ncbi:MAG: glutathione S-transferase family protein [Pseudomonadota bacterium]
MSERKVWGRATSSNVQAVMWALAELGLEAERIDVGLTYGGLDTPAFRAMNPNGLIPVLQENGLTMWECPAILRYLGAAYGDDAFWPRDPKARAPLDMWAEWMRSTFLPPFIVVFLGLVRTPPEKRDDAAIAAALEEVKGPAKLLDAHLEDGPYLAGEAFSFADIAIGTFLYRYFGMEIDRAPTPTLEAYYRRLTERPAYAEHVMVAP